MEDNRKKYQPQPKLPLRLHIKEVNRFWDDFVSESLANSQLYANAKYSAVQDFLNMLDGCMFE